MGACCIYCNPPNFYCDPNVASAEECDALAGDCVHLYRSLCEFCEHGTWGACCIAWQGQYRCEEESPTGCASLNGLYMGDFQVCTDTTCVFDVPGPCCIYPGEDPPYCIEVTRSTCIDVMGGRFFGEGRSCSEITCPEPGTGCREVKDPYWEEGDYVYSLDECEEITIRGQKRPASDNDNDPDMDVGYFAPISAHPVRARWASVDVSRCAYSAGVVMKKADGYAMHTLCNQPLRIFDSQQLTTSFVFKQSLDDEDNRVERGYYGVRSVVTPPPWHEVVYLHTPPMCRPPAE